MKFVTPIRALAAAALMGGVFAASTASIASARMAFAMRS